MSCICAAFPSMCKRLSGYLTPFNFHSLSVPLIKEGPKPVFAICRARHLWDDWCFGSTRYLSFPSRGVRAGVGEGGEDPCFYPRPWFPFHFPPSLFSIPCIHPDNLTDELKRVSKNLLWCCQSTPSLLWASMLPAASPKPSTLYSPEVRLCRCLTGQPLWERSFITIRKCTLLPLVIVRYKNMKRSSSSFISRENVPLTHTNCNQSPPPPTQGNPPASVPWGIMGRSHHACLRVFFF